jgi:L-ascorbate metabolism protein UlaG (beta-lactamase superfamily)
MNLLKSKWLLVLLLNFLSLSSDALTARWTGVAGVLLQDKTHCLWIDPILTKPSLSHWILGSTFLPDETIIKDTLSTLKLKKCDAFFASHTHFDHAVDISFLARTLNGIIYGGESLKRVTQYFDMSKSFVEISNGKTFTIGDFKITPYRRHHPQIMNLFHFMPGEIDQDFKAQFYHYKEGETWAYYVDHPEGRLLVDQGSHEHDYQKNIQGKVDYYFVGVANLLSIEHFIDKNIKPVGAKKIIPTHYDFFVLHYKIFQDLILPGTNLEKIKTQAEKSVEGLEWKQLKVFEELIIQK